MIDYEKLVEGIPMPQPAGGRGEASAAAGSDRLTTPDLSDPEATKLHAAEGYVFDPSTQSYLPLDHPKYAGIATSKGYKQGEEFSGHRLQKVSYSHEAMIDVLIAEPTITQNELAKRFERSVSWISIVMGSDAFQAALAKRRDDLTNPLLIATIEDRFRGLADRSLQIIADKLEASQSIDVAFKALDISAKALGFGARAASPGVTVQNSFVVQLPAKSASAAEWSAAHAPAPPSPPPASLPASEALIEG